MRTMGINDVNKVNKVFNQSDIDKAISEGYKIAENQYSLNILELKAKIKELTVSLESATRNKLNSHDGH